MPKIVKQSAKVKRAGIKVLSRIKPVSLENDFIKMSVYGRSGSGKTTFACTGPKPLLIIGAEDGTRSVHNLKGVDFIRLQHPSEINDLVDHLKAGTYKTVVLDTATSLQDMVLASILGLEELPIQKTWGGAKQQEWGQCALQMKEYLHRLLSLPMHVFILAQEREFNVESEQTLLMPYVNSALTPSVTGWLSPACDYVCQTFLRTRTETRKAKIGGKTVLVKKETDQVEYCLRTGAHAVYTSKFRLPKGFVLPEAIVDPTVTKVAELIKQGGPNAVVDAKSRRANSHRR